MTYRKNWGPSFGLRSESIYIDDVSVEIATLVQDIWDSTIAETPQEPSDDWRNAVKEFTHQMRNRMPFLGSTGICNFYDHSRGESFSVWGQYLERFKGVAINLSELTGERMIDCTGQSLALKLAVPQLEGWELYHSKRIDGIDLPGEENITVHTLLARRVGYNALILDSTKTSGDIMPEWSRFNQKYQRAEGVSLTRLG